MKRSPNVSSRHEYVWLTCWRHLCPVIVSLRHESLLAGEKNWWIMTENVISWDVDRVCVSNNDQHFRFVTSLPDVSKIKEAPSDVQNYIVRSRFLVRRWCKDTTPGTVWWICQCKWTSRRRSVEFIHSNLYTKVFRMRRSFELEYSYWLAYESGQLWARNSLKR